ncbi:MULTISPECIES: hypothetical protein [unclassified Leucobacter]|uniref:hypothetical protein n=1 Tax=unclassified Leucobacter TaxID=2621730 RepID=UPI00165D72BC|nr:MULTISPECIES: hypothetical protein [unclassified Leucobacter]MBC9927515.1 hypothetical protein [Leucobacter sp. cx-169]
MKDFQYGEKSGETEVSPWGLSDRASMEQAKDEVTGLHDAGQPFDLTMLTLDLHEPAHLFDHCPLATEAEMTSVVRSAMEQAAGFVTYLEETDYLEDAIVVLTGDLQNMLAEGGAFWDEPAGNPDHSLFNRLCGPDGVTIARHRIDELSTYGTTFDLSDLGRADKNAGIGVSVQLASVEPATESVLALTSDRCIEMVESRSANLYRTLWNPTAGPTVEVRG